MLTITIFRKKNNVFYKKYTIEFLSNYHYMINSSDIIKDDIEYPLRYIGINQLKNSILISKHVFDKFENGKLYFKPINGTNDLVIFYNALKNIKNEFIKNKGILTRDSYYFNINDIDENKLEVIKEIAKDPTNDIKFIEHEEELEQIEIFEYFTYERNVGNVLKLRLDSNVLLIDKSSNKIYVLTVPIGIYLYKLGIAADSKLFYLANKDFNSFDIKDKNFMVDLSKCNESNIKYEQDTVLHNMMVIVDKPLNYEVLKSTAEYFINEHNVDIIDKEYDYEFK